MESINSIIAPHFHIYIMLNKMILILHIICDSKRVTFRKLVRTLTIRKSGNERRHYSILNNQVKEYDTTSFTLIFLQNQKYRLGIKTKQRSNLKIQTTKRSRRRLINQLLLVCCFNCSPSFIITQKQQDKTILS